MKRIVVIMGSATLLVVGLTTCTVIALKQKEEVLPSPIQATVHVTSSDCPYTYVSWNLGNFGKSKSPETIRHMAKILRHADIVAAQEVTAGKNFGAQAVAQLAQALSDTGSEWDYVVSDPTRPASPGVERYAYLFKKKSISFNRDSAHLVSSLEESIDREPFAVTVAPKSVEKVSLFTMHAVPTAKSPIREIRALEDSDELKGSTRAIMSGDFNLGKIDTDPSFAKLGFTGYIEERTSIKMKPNGGAYLVKQYDNIYVKGVHVCSSGTIDFVKSFAPVTEESLAKARQISDHLPVYITFK